MQSNSTSPQLPDLGGIRCTRENLYELEGDRIMISVARNEVRRIELRYGVRAPHPILQLIAGAALFGVGIVGLGIFGVALQRGGRLAGTAALTIPFGVVGVGLVVGAFRRGYSLEVELLEGRKRMHFNAKVSPEQMKNFISAIERQWGLPGAATLR